MFFLRFSPNSCTKGRVLFKLEMGDVVISSFPVHFVEGFPFESAKISFNNASLF